MKEIKILIFKLGNEFYATDIMEVERILGYEETTVLPDSPDFLLGVIDYETSVLPIISLSKKFKITEGSKQERKIIVVKRESGKFGILVDSVSEVQSISDSDIKNPEGLSTLVSKKYITGLVKKDNNIIILINLDKVLTIEEEEEIIFRGE